MSKALSLKMDEQIFIEAEKILKKIRIPRNAYINKAVELYNRLQNRALIKNKLRKDVALLKNDPDPLLQELDLLDDFLA